MDENGFVQLWSVVNGPQVQRVRVHTKGKETVTQWGISESRCMKTFQEMEAVGIGAEQLLRRKRDRREINFGKELVPNQGFKVAGTWKRTAYEWDREPDDLLNRHVPTCFVGC
jgi:hypothetical protein